MHTPPAHAHLSLVNKHLVLGVSGSVAAYKAAELVRRLKEAGAEVRVVLTPGGAEFVTPLTFQALSGHPVPAGLLDTEAEAAMGHIQLARWADAVIVAPASANFIARLAHGRAEDLLSALCLATQAPVAIAPAMNQQMWAHAATQQNLTQLKSRGIQQWGPAQGAQACGETGPGRLLEVDDLMHHAAALFETGLLAGHTVLVTAGPTREAIDPVRFLSNRSSGKMGYAIAQAAAEAGARTILVSGPTALPAPPRVDRLTVTSAQEMHDAVMRQVGACSVFIAAAAVADYRPAQAAAQKIKKGAARLTLELEPTPDILAAVAALPTPPYTVGFAAETDNVLAHARDKRKRKRIDMIAANLVGEGLAFDQDTNALTVITDAQELQLDRAAKPRLARQLIALIAQHLKAGQ
jgi:phosphopantothenoylcysteine decarboxylase/phosphopantothenate--cysteine ligase